VRWDLTSVGMKARGRGGGGGGQRGSAGVAQANDGPDHYWLLCSECYPGRDMPVCQEILLADHSWISEKRKVEPTDKAIPAAE